MRITEIQLDNLLINAITSSSIILGSIFATMLGSTSAQAFSIPLEDAVTTCTENMECMLGDKFIYDISVSGDLNISDFGDSVVELAQNPVDPLNYEVVLDFLPNDPAFFQGNGAFEYTIEATEGLLTATGVDSDVFGLLSGGSTTIEKSGMSFTTIESIDGQTGSTNISPGQQSLDITDTLSTTGPGAINEFSNEFQQTVPEPATMLGIFAFGGLGLGLKRKKQQA